MSGRESGEVCLGGYAPGALGRVTELHGTYYHEAWGFDLFFEAKIASELAAFLGRYDEARDRFRVARLAGDIVGSLTVDGIDGEGEGARLRWFIVAPGQAGRGIGARLMDEAMTFCRGAGFRRVYLWTFAGLDPARRLYERAGFRLRKEHQDDQWGRKVTEQMFALDLG